MAVVAAAAVGSFGAGGGGTMRSSTQPGRRRHSLRGRPARGRSARGARAESRGRGPRSANATARGSSGRSSRPPRARRARADGGPRRRRPRTTPTSAPRAAGGPRAGRAVRGVPGGVGRARRRAGWGALGRRRPAGGEWQRRLADFERRGWHNRVSGCWSRARDPVRGARQPRGRHRGPGAVVQHHGAAAGFRGTTGPGKRDQAQGGEEKEQGQAGRVLDALRRLGGGWKVVSIEQRVGGRPPARLGEDRRVALVGLQSGVADEALTELAVGGGACRRGSAPADLATVSGSRAPRASTRSTCPSPTPASRPDVLEAGRPGRAVAAWAEAVDGDDAALLERWRPPEAGVGVALRRRRVPQDGASWCAARACCEIRDRGGRRVARARDDARRGGARAGGATSRTGTRRPLCPGSRDEATAFTERWTLSLDGADSSPWQITAVGHSPEAEKAYGAGWAGPVESRHLAERLAVADRPPKRPGVLGRLRSGGGAEPRVADRIRPARPGDRELADDAVGADGHRHVDGARPGRPPCRGRRSRRGARGSPRLP